MFRETFAALALATIVGCSASTTMSNPFGGKAQTAELASYAARTPYPSDTKAQEGREAAALIDPKSSDIKLMNFSDQPLRDLNVWVNGTFVQRIDVVAPHSTRTVSPDNLYDPTGHTMASLKATPSKVELQSGNALWSLKTADGH